MEIDNFFNYPIEFCFFQTIKLNKLINSINTP